MKNIVSSLMILCFTLLGVAQASWNLPGVDLVSREERGADESVKYRNSSRLQSAFDHPDYELGWIAGRGSLELLDEESHQEVVDQGKLIAGFLENYPGYYPMVVTNFVEQGNLLSWPQKFTSGKNSVTIHHTADGKQYRFPSDAGEGLREIYRQHAVSQGWGDIGYNFLIDPQGNIYEGRSGGEGVIGGHANLWNSMTSLGIALLGNFENVHPTSAAIHSLTHLTTLLTYQYSIDPHDETALFNRIQDEPYIEAHIHDESVLGHKDIKSTACPGEYLYALVPEIINDVSARLQWMYANWGNKELNEEDFITIRRAIRSDDRSAGFFVPLDQRIQTVSCNAFSDMTAIDSCEVVEGGVRVSLSYQQESSGRHTIGLTTDRGSWIISFSVVWELDLQKNIEEQKGTFQLDTPSGNQKMQEYILASDARKYLKEDISVLLYEPTRSGEVSLSCTGGCEVEIDDMRIANAQTIIVRQEGEQIVGFIDMVRHEAEQITVHDADGGPVQITSYERYSGDTPLNTYKGVLTMQIQQWRDLELGMREGFTIVNTLSFKDYLRGMGESSEVQHFEKTKALAYLTKTYALFYRTGNNPHPSIPLGVNYTAIDDPRSFQRYLGAGIEQKSPIWLQAVDATFDTLVVYDEFIPILPYYHCSAGFSWSGAEKFGWSDTPWLVSKKDLVSCETGGFEGHGVGMSGDGAEYLAQAGASAQEILQYRYQGISFAE